MVAAPALDAPATPVLNASAHLTNEEAQFIYNIEILGLPAKKAADMAGMSYGKMSAPHIIQARELAKREMRGTMQITKEDVVFGVHDAIGRAKIIAEPATEIRGWEVISKLLGYDAPQKVDINIRESIHVAQQHVKSLPDHELIKMLGAGNVIDCDFYVVPSKP